MGVVSRTEMGIWGTLVLVLGHNVLCTMPDIQMGHGRLQLVVHQNPSTATRVSFTKSISLDFFSPTETGRILHLTSFKINIISTFM